MKYRFLGILICIIVGILTVLPLFHPGFIPIHDSPQVARVYEMNKALRDGFFPVRVVSDLGYGFGYPIFNFYAPLSYYLGGLLAFMVSPLIATKLMIGVGMILAGISMYLLSRSILKTESAIVASVLYLLAPYHAVNLYVRGAVGELFAYAFLPLVFWGLLRIVRKPSISSVLLAGISLAGIVLSHNLTALMLVPYYLVFLCYLLYRTRKIKNTRMYLIAAAVLGLGLSCFYWLPAFLEMGYTNVASVTTGGSVYKDHFVCLSQLWSSQWGFGGSAPGCLDGLSFQIGKIHILLFGLGILALFFKSSYRKMLAFSVLGGIVSVIMLLPISQPIWDAISLLHYVQFPWRYLGFVSLFFSLAGGIVVSLLPQFKLVSLDKRVVPIVVAAFILVLSFALYLKYFTPQRYLTKYEDQTTRNLLLWDISKISDEYLPKNFVKPSSESEVASTPILAKDSTVTYISNKTQEVKATISSPNGENLILNKAVFPFWRVSLNKHVSSTHEVNGRYEITVPKGQSKLDVQFVSTPLEKLANTISLISLVIALLGIIPIQRYFRHAKTT